MRRLRSTIRENATPTDTTTGQYAGRTSEPAHWSRRTIARGSAAAFVVAVAALAALGPSLPSASADSPGTPTDTVAVPEAPTDTAPVTQAPTDLGPEVSPETTPPPEVPTTIPETPPVTDPGAVGECPAPVPGHWAGIWTSRSGIGGTIDQYTTLSGTALSGTVTLTGSVYSGGDVVGRLDCRAITLGFVIGVASFDGTLSADGLSASGTYTAPAVDDTGTWSTHFVPDATTPVAENSGDPGSGAVPPPATCEGVGTGARVMS